MVNKGGFLLENPISISNIGITSCAKVENSTGERRVTICIFAQADQRASSFELSRLFSSQSSSSSNIRCFIYSSVGTHLGRKSFLLLENSYSSLLQMKKLLLQFLQNRSKSSFLNLIPFIIQVHFKLNEILAFLLHIYPSGSVIKYPQISYVVETKRHQIFTSSQN